MRLLCLALCFSALLTLSACGDDDNPTTPTASAMMSLSGNLAFGNVTIGTTATSTLTITNSGNADLTVTGIAFPAGFTGNWSSGTIARGASQAVIVTFAPTAAQAYTGTLTVNTNPAATSNNTMSVTGTGTAVPTFTLSGLVTETPPTTSTVVSGVVVTVIDGANQGKTATTGADGRYQITGVVNGGFTVSATKAGYVGTSLPVGINGNTTLDFRLEPVAPRMSFGPGQYRVGTDIPAGRYYTDPAGGCHFQRLRGFGGTSADVITDLTIDFDAGQWIVDLLATDAGFATEANCGTWFTTPRRGLLTNITPGMWIVGAQVSPGTYRADNSIAGCYWQRLSSFTGNVDAIIANGLTNSAGAQLVTIASGDAGFSATMECGTWIRQ